MIPTIPKPRMNRTEREYSEYLELKKRAGMIISYEFEKLGFRLAKKTFYYPDFIVVKKDCFEIHEVKGFWRDDALVKIKTAAELFPWFKWISVSKGKGEWIVREFN